MHYDIPEEALPWDLAFANNMIFKESSVSYQKKRTVFKEARRWPVPVVLWQAARNWKHVILPLEAYWPYNALI